MRTEMTERPVTIDVRNLSYTYPNGFQALKNVSLQIRENDFFAFIGQNGSGKTTLAKHFVGLLRPTSGQVVVNGIDTKKAAIVDLAKQVGYVFQNADDQIFSDTVESEVAYGPNNLDYPPERIKEAVEKSLEELGILHLRKRHPLSLSWGDRQKVAIGSILAMGPNTIILDEPTTGQDLRGSYEILETCASLHRQGKTIIIITHNMRLVTEFCKYVVVLYEGEILAEGEVSNVFLDAETLHRSYIEPPQVTRLASLLNSIYPTFPKNILTVPQMVAALNQLHSQGGGHQ
ncbi:MAG: energy-coupling factor ABC transporter ATP-binding protein [Chloroflexi bacterium]|nr:energy-coupling factor ABC transporter ATP-binding protein [Chloroflexota bacterium]MCL5074432.1 energy-coupling factor ABC transporter ATP-binding protein [Chloroflexota bacterium]